MPSLRFLVFEISGGSLRRSVFLVLAFLMDVDGNAVTLAETS